MKDSLKFPEVKKLLERICKILGFKLIHSYFYYYSQVKKFWRLCGENDEIIFLDIAIEDPAHDKSQTAKALLKRILNSRSFKTFEGKIIQNPFYNLDFTALKIKLDLLDK